MCFKVISQCVKKNGRKELVSYVRRFLQLRSYRDEIETRKKFPSLREYFQVVLELQKHHTVATLNSCTECVSCPAIVHDRTPDCYPVSWACMPPQVPDFTVTKCSFESEATWVIDVLVYFLTSYLWFYSNHALTDIRSTGAGIKCLYCRPFNVNV